MMRERLAELIADARNDYYDYSDELHEKGMSVPESSEEYIADCLIANGVVVLPCKVGGKVYIISRNKVKECLVSYIGLSAVEKYSSINFVEYYADGTFYRTHFVEFDAIGKTVFLSREDAERELKGVTDIFAGGKEEGGAKE